jgi:hypothetical protein
MILTWPRRTMKSCVLRKSRKKPKLKKKKKKKTLMRLKKKLRMKMRKWRPELLRQTQIQSRRLKQSPYIR